MNPLLRLRDVSRSIQTVRAPRGVAFSPQAGEVHAPAIHREPVRFADRSVAENVRAGSPE